MFFVEFQGGGRQEIYVWEVVIDRCVGREVVCINHGSRGDLVDA